MSTSTSFEFTPMDKDSATRSCAAKAWVASVSIGSLASVVAIIALAVGQGQVSKSINAKLLDCGDGVIVREKAECDSGNLKCNCPPAVNDLCPKPPEGLTVIPDAKRLTLAQKKAIVAGVHKMKEVPSQYDDNFNAWDYFVITHQKATLPDSEVHAGWWFYPWHRELMRRFNAELRRVTGDPEITFAYWNWADTDSTAAIFGLDYMGPQAGLQQHQYVLKEGNFREGKWKITKDLQFLQQEKSFGGILRAPGNGLQMCFDQDQNSYFLE